MSTFIEDAMMKEAAEVLAQNGVSLTAEFFKEGDGEIVLSLTEAPFTQLTLKVKP